MAQADDRGERRWEEARRRRRKARRTKRRRRRRGSRGRGRKGRSTVAGQSLKHAASVTTGFCHSSTS